MALLLTIMTLLQSAASYESNMTGFGGYDLQDITSPALRQALQAPSYTNSLAFQGFNVTKNLTSVFSGTLSSTNNWQLEIDFSAANDSGSTVEVVIYALNFADEEFPNNQYPLNTSDWSICASIFPPPFSSQVQNANGANASCVPYIGQQCYDSFIGEFNQATLNGDCRNVPSFSQIEGCGNIFDSGGGSGGTAAITNTTIAGLVHYPNNGSWIDPATGAVYTRSTLPQQGLSSGQTFGYIQRVVSNTTSLAKDAQLLNMIALTIVPNQNNVNTGGTGYGPQSRLLCGRANLQTPGTNNAARELPSRLLLAFLSVVVAVMAL